MPSGPGRPWIPGCGPWGLYGFRLRWGPFVRMVCTDQPTLMVRWGLAGSPEMALLFSEPDSSRVCKVRVPVSALPPHSCLGSIPLPLSGHFRARLRWAVVSCEPHRRAGRGGVGPAAVCFALPHLSEKREMHLDSRPGPCPASPRQPPRLHTQLPGSGPRSVCTLGRASRPAGLSCPRGPGRVGAARQGAQECGGPRGSCFVCLCGLCCVFLTRALSASACLHLCLNLELSVSLCLVVSSLWVCPDLPCRLSICLPRVWVPTPALPPRQSVAWERLSMSVRGHAPRHL